MPIQVTGLDASGHTFTEGTGTVWFNQEGAGVSLIHGFLPNDMILIKNFQNGVEEEFRVVSGFFRVISGSQKWGVEALDQDGGVGWSVGRGPYG